MRPILLMLAACVGSADTEPTVTETDTGPGDPVAPLSGDWVDTTLDCSTHWEPPEAFTDGLAHHEWTLEDLTFEGSWGLQNRFETPFLSDDRDTVASSRVRPWLSPALSKCLVDRLREAPGSSTPVSDAVLGAVPFVEQSQGIDALRVWTFSAPSYDFGGAPLYEALAGVAEAENPFGGPNADTPDDDLLAAAQAWPAAAQEPLAELVLALAEATALKEAALAKTDLASVEAIHTAYLEERWWTDDNAFVQPTKDDINDLLIEEGDNVKHLKLHQAGQAVAVRVDAVLAALADVEPFEGGDLTFRTPFGWVVLSASDSDDVRTAEDLEKVALLVDLGGNDAYEGQYGSTHKWWMGAGVLVDVRGDDTYGADTPDITDFETAARDAFHGDHGFTQGAGLFGVGILADGEGSDLYWAGNNAQGAGFMGVGVLYDGGAGSDDYQLGTHGQGEGFFGTGLLVDAGGDDTYGVFTMGQGAGKPRGLGVLVDGDGDDVYIGYYNAMDDWLPEPGYPDHYGYPSSWPYSESDGTPHYMSCAQGVGWGYRGDWFDDRTNWAGGLGALVDLGEGADVHYADDMSMGQGFVYGHGLLYDDGGDDTYRMFWWGMGAAAHMGVGVLWDQDGNDDYGSAWASAGFGYDWSIGWNLDYGGDDVYSGKFYYGRAYTYGMSFMINDGGDDLYNADSAYSPYFGVVYTGTSGTKLLGAFLDLGGGDDTYNTTVEGPGNDTVWYHEPVGSNTNDTLHKGIGVDQ